MTKLSWRVVVALLALVVTTSACSGSPTAPDPVQPGPPVVNPPPTAASWIVIDEVLTPKGQPIPYEVSGQSYLRIAIRWAFDPNIPGTVAVRTYLSEDCTSVILSSRDGIRAAAPTGAWTSSSGLQRFLGISRTNCVIGRVEQVDSEGNTLQVVAETKKVYELNFFDAGFR